MTTVTKAAIAAAALLLALAAWFAWRDHRAQGEREAALRALSAEQTRAAEYAARLRETAAVVRVRVDTVRVTATRWRVVAGEAPALPRVDTVTNVDTLRTYVAQLLAHVDTLRVAGDSLERACTALANDCEVLRVRADSLPGVLTKLREATERAVKAAPPRRRWSPLGCSGPGVASPKGVALGIGCGVSYSL